MSPEMLRNLTPGERVVHCTTGAPAVVLAPAQLTRNGYRVPVRLGTQHLYLTTTNARDWSPGG